MIKRSITNLPLHFGQAPPWLFERMIQLAREITIAIIREFGPEEMLIRLANPYWFQAFGCVLGFDWHSSGLTTTTTAALKEGIKDLEKDLGFFVCGGKGKTSRKTPEEIKGKTYQLINLSTDQLTYASKMSAKVDNTALQDGYQLYHHTFYFIQTGKWAVVQQGMSDQTHYARRYHWYSDEVSDFVCEPEKVVDNQKVETLNLVAQESLDNRLICAKIAQDPPEKIIKTIKQINQHCYHLPQHHEIFIRDLKPESLEKIFLKTYENQPANFEKLLSIGGVGPKTIRALSLLAELIYNAPASRHDPVKYSYTHGGKDGIPYPVDRENYDHSIRILRKALERAKIGEREKILAFKRLGYHHLSTT